MRDNDEIHEAVKHELCDPKHGCCGHNCRDICDEYNKVYDDIELEWSAEK